SAKDGSIVKLGNSTYYTDGILIDKDITIRGQKGSRIHGEGTSKSIFYLNSDATGATIENVEITDGNNGIFVQDAADVTLKNLEIYNIGIEKTIREGSNNTGIILDHAEGFELVDSTIYDIGKKAVGVSNTDGGLVSNLTIYDVNIDAQHAHSHDAGGIKLFNTNDIVVKNNHLEKVNAIILWNDITSNTTIKNNKIENVGEDFLAPAFNNFVEPLGIYNEKSVNASIKHNKVTAIGEFTAFRATEFSTETMTLKGNEFSNFELGTTDYWANEAAEKLVAITEDPDAAGFELFANDYLSQANIGD
ncbi:MAG: right-handed parallel beta-helix repeat-containing protein, partial [Cyanobacteria bacterium J06642_3]